MQRWPIYLAEAPAGLLRLIAATHRISLPRRCSPAERLARIRSALCRPAAVRAQYAALSSEIQAAAQALRIAPRSLPPAEVTARFGPLRSLAALQADRRPQSPAEYLLLAGWLLPRPARPHHPFHYVVPPEVRAWLPQPLAAAPAPPPPALPGPPPAVRAATALLCAAAVQPLPRRRDGTLAMAALHRLVPLLTPLEPEPAAALIAWVAPLLVDGGMLAAHGAAVAPTPAGARFLARSPAERLRHLRDAWVAAPRPDANLLPPRTSRRGLDWATLRRRLIAWAATPDDQPPRSAADFAALTAAYGPLADSTTHWRPSGRTPWRHATAAAVWQRALAGPLAWLGISVRYAPVAAAPWQAAANDCVRIPHGAEHPDLLALAAYGAGLSADADALIATFSPAALARSTAGGRSWPQLVALLEAHTGPLPAAWHAQAPAATMRLERGALLLTDQPELLRTVLRRRSVRRAVRAVPAPGIALVAPGQEAALIRALAREHIALDAPPPAAAPPPADFSPAELAALLAAALHYRTTAPAGAPFGPTDQMIERLWTALPPSVAVPLWAALHPSPPADPVLAEPLQFTQHSPAELVPLLRTAMRRRELLALLYQGAADAEAQVRIVRPLWLERHADQWYLQAYCHTAHAERSFRLDRIAGIAAHPAPNAAPPPAGPPRRSSDPIPPTSGFFAVPPNNADQPNSGIWLSDD